MTYHARVRCEWDENKNAANQRKHGVSFEEASDLFKSSQDYLEIFDVDHASSEEDRFIAIGPITRGQVLVVWTQREEDVVRIISARWATKRERKTYIRYMERRHD